MAGRSDGELLRGFEAERRGGYDQGILYKYVCIKVPKNKHKGTTMLLNFSATREDVRKPWRHVIKFLKIQNFGVQSNIHSNGKAC